MKTYYDKPNQRLVFRGQSANPAFWDQLWQQGNLTELFRKATKERFYTGVTRRFLPDAPSANILEGGCGRGEVVVALQQAGYQVTGIDFAQDTVKRVKEFMPNLPIQVGDVNKLDFPDNHFDGYWSLGVIEHSFSGYQPIIAEMRRIVKPGGYLFITFPQLSPLRRTKAALNLYPTFTNQREPTDFYQFALAERKVKRDLQKLGFTLVYARSVDGFKGLKEEVPAVRPMLQAISNHPSRLASFFGSAITELTAPICGHIKLLVMRKL